ncbi:hypothetical protein ABZW30_19655 [Kitasatospora sp. NPDC004669]
MPAGNPRDLIGFARGAEESGFSSLIVDDSPLTPLPVLTRPASR